jgi:hypothetical protein
MPGTLTLTAMDYIGPTIAAGVFVVIMSFVREPTRRYFNAVFVGGATGVYMSGGGFGVWELAFPLVALPIVYLGLRAHVFIGVVWLMHSGWDIAHHWWGNPIWPFAPTSSFGCMIFDALIAVWFIAGAPSLVSKWSTK